MFLLAVFLIGGMLTKAYAVQGYPSSCDAQYMDALEAKAWLHAQRRITQNKNLILRPDSVLEYSCFDQFLGYIAANPDARRFSENRPAYPLWNPVITAVNEFSLDIALIETIYIPLITYLQQNFQHTYLGGRTEPVPGAPPPWGEYNCTAMQYVWSLARCRDYIDEFEETLGAFDGFYDFPWYTANDPRVFPPNMPVCDPHPNMADGIIEAYRGEGQDGVHGDEWPSFVLFDENDPFPQVYDETDDGGLCNGLYCEDPIENVLTEYHNDLIIHGACDESAVIPTGVLVQRDDGFTHDEHVCSKPGCSYDGGDCVR